MTNNNLRHMLREAAESGVVPTKEEIMEIITERHGLGEIQRDYLDIRGAAQRAVDAAGHKRLLAGVIAAAVEGTPGRATNATSKESVELGGNTTGGYSVAGGKRSGARDFTAQEPLRQLMRDAAGGHQISERDLDKLELDPAMSDDDRAAFKAEILDAGKEVAAVFAGGHQAEARRLGASVAGDFGHHLARPEPADTPDDPAALAALLPRR